MDGGQSLRKPYTRSLERDTPVSLRAGRRGGRDRGTESHMVLRPRNRVLHQVQAWRGRGALGEGAAVDPKLEAQGDPGS